MTLKQQAFQVVQVLPDNKLKTLIEFAHFLAKAPEAEIKSTHQVRKPGILKGQIWMADDFNRTPDEFKEYI